MTDIVQQSAGELTRQDLESAFNTFDHAAARFLATRKSDDTRDTYRRGLEAYRRHAAELGADPLRGDALIAYNVALERRRRDKGGDRANDTIRARLKAVQSFLSWCWAFNETPLKPETVSELLTLPPAKKLSPRDILTADEARRLIDAADPGRDRCLIRVMLDGGLRVSEAVALTAGDVYSAADRYYLHVARGKGDKEREVEIPAELFRELVAYAGEIGLDPLDPRHAGAPLFDIHRATAWRVVTATAEQTRIRKNVTPHGLRHTHAHHLRLSGYPLEVIGRRLGHASIETTKQYTRPAEQEQQIQLPAMPWASEAGKNGAT